MIIERNLTLEFLRGALQLPPPLVESAELDGLSFLRVRELIRRRLRRSSLPLRTRRD